MGLKKTGHTHDVGVAEGGQGAAFDQEAVQSALVAIAVARGVGRHGLARGAEGDLLGQVLLDGHARVEVDVGGQVGDAEATLAQHAVDAVFVQAKAGWQGQGGAGLRWAWWGRSWDLRLGGWRGVALGPMRIDDGLVFVLRAGWRHHRLVGIVQFAVRRVHALLCSRSPKGECPIFSGNSASQHRMKA